MKIRISKQAGPQRLDRDALRRRCLTPLGLSRGGGVTAAAVNAMIDAWLAADDAQRAAEGKGEPLGRHAG